MKYLRIGFIILFTAMLLLPTVFFNFQEESISEIDNRELTRFPKSAETVQAFTADFNDYVNDRIGFRNELINSYTVLNDKLFSIMVHPTYTYGQEGYVFFKVGRSSYNYEYLEAFAQSVKKMQKYCEARGVPFIVFFTPAKTTVYSQYLPKGLVYNNEGVQWLLNRFGELGIECVDSTPVLEEKSKTDQVYNVKYDAGHWNDLGAFYGTNELLSEISRYFPAVRQNTLDDFEVSTRLETSLPVSQFTINEEVPVFTLKNDYASDLTEEYSADLKMDPNYRTFSYSHNGLKNEAPKVLMFQGSYLNSRTKYLKNQFREYITVHNYQNVLDLDYYFQIFEPECVVFEFSEYTLSNTYFSYEKMEGMEFGPPYSDFEGFDTVYGAGADLSYTANEEITDITVTGIPNSSGYAYLCREDYAWELKWDDESESYHVSVPTREFSAFDSKVQVVDKGVKTEYLIE